MKSLTIGANQTPLQGPGKITHEGGDAVLIADLENGIPGTERTLVFEGEEVVVEGDDEFQPAEADERTTEIGEAVLLRALGQANVTFTQKAKPEPKKPAAKKEAKSAA